MSVPFISLMAQTVPLKKDRAKWTGPGARQKVKDHLINQVIDLEKRLRAVGEIK